MIGFWIFYAVCCTMHIGICYLEKEKARHITKLFLMPLLMVGLALEHAFSFLVLFGMLMGWLGDILMLYRGNKKCFLLGALFFASGHVVYIMAMFIKHLQKNPWTSISPWFYVLAVLIAAILFIISKFKIEKHMGILAYIGAGYFTLLAVACCFGLFTGQYLLSLAFLIFIVSDIILTVCRFAKDVKREHVYIMTTYILAQTLICVGFIKG